MKTYYVWVLSLETGKKRFMGYADTEEDAQHICHMLRSYLHALKSASSRNTERTDVYYTDRIEV